MCGFPLKRLIALYTSIALAAASFADDKTPCDVVPTKVTVKPDFSRVDLAPKHNSEREAAIIDWWEETCPNFRQQKVRRYRQKNLICRINGTGENTLVIGAHYDKVKDGYGVADNWSGVVLIDELMNYYRSQRLEMNLEFVAFSGEEDGLFGSKDFVRNLNYPVAGMINLDTIGLTDLIIDRDSDPKLACQAKSLAAQLDIPVRTQFWRELSSDWQRFAAKGIPAIGFHSVTKRTLSRIHHRRDKAGNVDIEHLQNAFVLTIGLIDQAAGGNNEVNSASHLAKSVSVFSSSNTPKKNSSPPGRTQRTEP